MPLEPSLQYAAPCTTFYKRKLPSPPAIAFSSPEGKLIFAEALAEGTVEGFFSLVEQFCTQDEPAFCGLASLAMVLNTLAIDPKRSWKGPWRWFHELMLDCCKPISEIQVQGITLDQAACLARCNGASLEMLRFSDFSLAAFRAEVARICSSQQEHLIVSYSRKALQQTGDGHFSPIGGFHAGQDWVLILDVARFKYPPHWVPLTLLHQAMGYKDPVTGLPRGYLRLGASRKPTSVLFSLNSQASGWKEAKAFLDQAVLTFASALSEAEAVASFHAGAALHTPEGLIAIRQVEPSECSMAGTCVQPDSVKQMLSELRSCRLYVMLNDCQNRALKGDAGGSLATERQAASLLMAAAAHRRSEPAAQGNNPLAISSRHQILAAEVEFLASQYVEMPTLQEPHHG